MAHDIEEAVFLGDRICIMGLILGTSKLKSPFNLIIPATWTTLYSPEFIDLYRQVFECIREETLKSMEKSH